MNNNSKIYIFFSKAASISSNDLVPDPPLIQSGILNIKFIQHVNLNRIKIYFFPRKFG